MSPKPCPSTKNQTLVAKAAILSSATVIPASTPMSSSAPLPPTLVTLEQQAESVQIFQDFNYGYNRLLATKNAILMETNAKMLQELYGQMATSLVNHYCFPCHDFPEVLIDGMGK